MKTLFGVYDNELHARQVAQELVNAGFAPEHIHVVDQRWRNSLAETQVGAYDTGEERQGSFADVEPAYHDSTEERQGTFADSEPSYRDRAEERQGSFADSEPVYHDRSQERRGSFADGQAEGSNAEQLVDSLTQIGLTHDEAEIYASQVNQGAAVVVVHAEDENIPKAASIISVLS